MQNETQNKIENVIKGLENKVSSDKLEIALNQHTEETYASKVKKRSWITPWRDGFSNIKKWTPRLMQLEKTVVEQGRETVTETMLVTNIAWLPPSCWPCLTFEWSICAILQSYISQFRVAELRGLLMFARRNRRGCKKELYERAMSLVDGDCPDSIAFKIQDLAWSALRVFRLLCHIWWWCSCCTPSTDLRYRSIVLRYR